eukprot:Selendium_serpulae@DN5841_c0_g1_i3.p1
MAHGQHQHRRGTHQHVHHHMLHRGRMFRRRVEEGIISVDGMNAVSLKNSNECRLVFVALHDFDEGPDNMRPFALEFFTQYPDVQAAWILPQAPYHADEGFSWWPNAQDPREAVKNGCIKKLCRTRPEKLSRTRTKLATLLEEVERQFLVAPEMTVLLGCGQGSVIGLDCLFNLPSLPRAIGLWNPQPALMDDWREKLAQATPKAKTAMLNVPVFVQDNTVKSCESMCCQLVDCFLTFEDFKMTSFNDDHLGVFMTPTDAGNFFRFVNPPRGSACGAIQRPNAKRAAGLFDEEAKRGGKYFCGWPWCGTGK